MTVLVHEDVDLPEKALTGTESREPVSIEPLFTEEELQELEFTTDGWPITVDDHDYNIPTFSFLSDKLMLPPWIETNSEGNKVIRWAVALMDHSKTTRKKYPIKIAEVVTIPFGEKGKFMGLLREAAAHKRQMREEQVASPQEANAQTQRARSLGVFKCYQDPNPHNLNRQIDNLNPEEVRGIAKRIPILKDQLPKAEVSQTEKPKDADNSEDLNIQQIQDADTAFQAEFGDIFKEELTITLPNPDDTAQEIQYPIKGFYLGELEEDELGETVKSKVFALPPVIEVFPGERLVSMSIPVIKMAGEPSKMIGFELIRVPVSPDDLRRQLIGYGRSLDKIRKLSLTTKITSKILNIMHTLRDQHQKRYKEALGYAILDITSFGEFIISERVLQRIKEQKFESIPGLDNGEPTNVKFLFKHMSKILNTITE